VQAGDVQQGECGQQITQTVDSLEGVEMPASDRGQRSDPHRGEPTQHDQTGDIDAELA